MLGKLSHVRWGPAALGALLAFCVSFVVVFLTISAYGMSLGIAARGAPDTARINRFAHDVAPLLGPAVLALCTLLAARRVGRRSVDPPAQGLATGVLAGVFGFLPGRQFDVLHLAALVAVVAAGWLGGALAARRATA